MNSIRPSRRELAQSYAAGAADGVNMSALYRAYIRGAYDASGCGEQEQRSFDLRLAVSAMAFAFLGWVFLMIMVFK